LNGVPAAEGEIVAVEAGDGRRLRGRLWRAGERAPLLLAVHGVMSHGLWLQDLALALAAAGIALLAADRRGAGLNRAAGEPEDDLVLLDDLEAWVARAGRDSEALHLLGFCWGSNYALHFLGHRPAAALRSLILVAPGIVPLAGATVRQPLDALPPETFLSIPLALEDFTRGPKLESFLRPDPLRLTATSVRFVRIQQRIGQWSAARLTRLRLPLLLILAAEDRISDNARTRALFARARAEPKALVTVESAHGVSFDAPLETAAACRDWLDRLG
jgi:alpha-beta hydrolase superfamily lysophospholipase